MAVMMSTLIFGTFMGRVQILLCPPTAEDKKELRAYSQIGTDALRLSVFKKRGHSVNQDAKTRTVSHYEEMLHPNLEEDPEENLRMSMLEQAGDSAASWATSKFV